MRFRFGGVLARDCPNVMGKIRAGAWASKRCSCWRLPFGLLTSQIIKRSGGVFQSFKILEVKADRAVLEVPRRKTARGLSRAFPGSRDFPGQDVQQKNALTVIVLAVLAFGVRWNVAL